LTQDVRNSSKRPAPLSVRVTPEQRAELDRLATESGLTVGGLIKLLLFNTPPSRRSRLPTAYNKQLSLLLSALGRISGNVNRCALIANMGSWPEADRLQTVSDTVLETCQAIMRELGRVPHDDKDQPNP
jgi:hypothetical protein